MYDYRSLLETDERTFTTKLALNAHSADENVAVGAWAMLSPAAGIYRSTAKGAAGGQGGGDEDDGGAKVGKGARSQRSPCPIAIVTGLQYIVSLGQRFK